MQNKLFFPTIRIIAIIILILIILSSSFITSKRENFESNSLVCDSRVSRIGSGCDSTSPTNVNIKYYVITIGKPERIENIKRQQEKLKVNIELINGVVGKNLSDSEIRTMSDPIIKFISSENLDDDKNYNKIKKNEIGCYLSHYNLYKKIAADSKSSKYSVIFEDDFDLVENFEKEIETVSKLNEEFDIIYLYLHRYTETEKKTDNICIINEETNLYGLSGYIVNNKNIQKIIEETKIMKDQIDVQLQNAVYSKKLEAYKFCPYIVKNSPLPSTIQTI